MDTNKENANTKPAFIIWFVPENEKAPWTKIGVLFKTKNGVGFNEVREFQPLQPGKVVMLKPKVEEKK